MGFLPEIDDTGHIKETPKAQLYTPPRSFSLKQEEEALSELNNLGHKLVAEDFSDAL